MPPPQAPDFGLLFDALPTPHLALEPDQTVAAVNAAMCQRVGQPAHALLGAAAPAVLPLLAPGDSWARLLAALDSQRQERTVAVQSPAGRPLSLIVRPVPAAAEEPLRYLLVLEAPAAPAPPPRPQEQFRLLSEFIPQLVWTTDAQGRPDYFNQRWLDYTGHAGLAAPDPAWTSQLHLADQPAAAQRWAEALQSGTAYRAELRLRGQDGRFRWFLVQAQPLRAAHGRVSQWLGTCTDVDDAKRVQQRLLAKDRQLQQILGQVPAYVATLFGAEHLCSFATPNFLALLGGRLRVGWSITETVPELREQGIAALLDDAYRTGRTTAVQARAIAWHHADAQPPERRYYDLTLQPLFAEAGQPQGVLFFAVDATERVLAQQRNERLSAAVRRRDEQVRAMTEALPLISFSQAPSGRLVYVSPQWAGYTGVSAATRGRDWRSYVHPDDLAAVASSFVRARRHRAAWSSELRLRQHDGQYRWHLARSLPVFDAQQRLSRWYGSLTDVHEQQALAERLRHSEQQLRFMANAVPLFAWTALPSGTLDYANQRYYEYTGLAPDAIGTAWLDTIHPDDHAPTLLHWQHSLGSGQDYQVEHRVRGANGQYRWYLVRATPMRDEEGRILKWYGSSTDIHDQRGLNDRLRRSEERFRFLTQSIPHIIWTANAQGVLDYLSPQWFRLTGQDPHDPSLLGPAGGWVQALHPDDLAVAQHRMAQALQARLPYTMDVRLRHRDGHYRWHLVRGVPEIGADGQVLRLYGSNTDIHELHELQQELRRSEAEFRFLADSIPQLVWTLEPDGTVSFLNEGWLEYTGLGLEDVQREGWGTLVPAPERDAALQMLTDNVRAGRYHEQENRLRRAADGQYRWHLHRARPMRDAEGRIVRWFGTSTDIDDYKRFQHEMEARHAELLRINQDLDNFVYTASHDLRQPIDNMAGIFQELTRSARFDDPETPVLMTMFEHSLDQIYTTIQELSALVQVQKQSMQVAPEEVRLERLTQEVLHSIGEQIRGAGAVVETDFSALPAIHFVRPNLQSVLYNLISNAVKYRSPERPPRIRVWTERDEQGHSVLSVQDNGLGIDLQRYGGELFQLFRRFHDHVPGSGTGLYLVQRLVQAHGGQLEVESTPGEGTTFRVRLLGGVNGHRVE
ncbi:hypothetical protein GCM10027048_36160 [Hymenobacter coalescens]